MTILEVRPSVATQKPPQKVSPNGSEKPAADTIQKEPPASAEVQKAHHRPGPKEMTQGHKDAISSGRAESKAVRAYLEALEEMKPRKGRPRSKDSIEKRLASLIEEIGTQKPERRLQLIQQRLDLTAELARLEAAPDIAPLTAEFCRHAASYGTRHNISVQAWREVGVSRAVLDEAGITR